MVSQQGGTVPDWLIAGSTTFGQTCVSLGFLAFALYAPALSEATGLDERDFSFAGSCVFLSVSLASPFAARLVAQLGTRGTMLVTMLGMALASLLTAFATWPAAMLAGLVFGIFYGLYSPASITVTVTRTSPKRRGLWLAVRQSGVPLAGALAGRILPPVIIAGGLVAGVLTVAGAILLGAVLVLLLPNLYRAAAGEDRQARPAHAAPRGSFLSRVIGAYRMHGPIQVVALAAVVFAIAHLALATFSYFYLLEAHGFSEIAAGVFLSNVLLTATIGRPLMGLLVDWTGSPVRVLAFIAFLGAAGFVAILMVDANTPAWVLLLVACLAGMSSNTWTPVYLAAASASAPPGQVAAVNGRAFAYAALGWTLAAPVIWTLIELFDGYTVPFLILLVMKLCVMVVLLAIASSIDPRGRLLGTARS